MPVGENNATPYMAAGKSCHVLPDSRLSQGGLLSAIGSNLLQLQDFAMIVEETAVDHSLRNQLCQEEDVRSLASFCAPSNHTLTVCQIDQGCAPAAAQDGGTSVIFRNIPRRAMPICVTYISWLPQACAPFRGEEQVKAEPKSHKQTAARTHTRNA